MTIKFALPVLVSICAAAAQASVVTAVPNGVNTDVITFSPYNTTTTTIQAPLNAIDVGAAEGLESVLLSFDNPGSDVILGAVPTSLGDNGSWPFDGAFAGLNANTGFMTFNFSRGLSFVGGFFNFDPGALDGNALVTALDANNNPIQFEEVSLNDNLGQPGASGQGWFYGFSRSAADIWGIQLSNSRVVVDNLTFNAAATNVPEPGALALVALALGALALTRRRA